MEHCDWLALLQVNPTHIVGQTECLFKQAVRLTDSTAVYLSHARRCERILKVSCSRKTAFRNNPPYFPACQYLVWLIYIKHQTCSFATPRGTHYVSTMLCVLYAAAVQQYCCWRRGSTSVFRVLLKQRTNQFASFAILP